MKSEKYLKEQKFLKLNLNMRPNAYPPLEGAKGVDHQKTNNHDLFLL
jgi:hypothetical protein